MLTGDDLTRKGPVVEVAEIADAEGVRRDSEDMPAPEDDATKSETDSDEEDSGEEWEIESLYEDAFQHLTDEDLRKGGKSHNSLSYPLDADFPPLTSVLVPDACTLEEALYFRKRLRAIGEVDFIKETIFNDSITAKKLCTAFGIAPPLFLEGAPDKAYYPLLSMGMGREITKRLKLPEHNTIDDAVALLKKSKNIMVVTGAGVCTLNGLYACSSR